MSSGLSGFCSPAPGSTHDYSHTVCERRLRENLLVACSCPDHADDKPREDDA